MFEVSVRVDFSAAHHLEGYSGKCSEQHGHNWEVEVFVRGDKLNETGILVDFRYLKETVASVLDVVDHTDLNKLDMFTENNPTSENIARFLYRALSVKLNCAGYRIHRVSVRETPGTGASYWEEEKHD